MTHRFARPSTSGPFGKNDTRLQCLVPESIALEFKRLALEQGGTDSEALRMMVFEKVLGKEQTRASLIARIDAMLGTESESTPGGGD